MVGGESSTLSTHETVGQVPSHAWPYWVSAKDMGYGTYRSYKDVHVSTSTLCLFFFFTNRPPIAQNTKYTIRRSALSLTHASAWRPIIKNIAPDRKSKKPSGNKLAALSKAMAMLK